MAKIVVKITGAKAEALAELRDGGPFANKIGAWLNEWPDEVAFFSQLFPQRIAIEFLEQLPNAVSHSQKSGDDENDAGRGQLTEVVFLPRGYSIRGSGDALLKRSAAPQPDADGTHTGSDNSTVNPPASNAGHETSARNSGERLPPFQVFAEPHQIHDASRFVPCSAPWWDRITGHSLGADYFTFTKGVQQ